MSTAKPQRPKARLPRGFRDRTAAEIAAERACLDTIRKVYESYGFEPLETPAFEYTDALGKFLPDVDRPNEGVFSLRDDDEQWLSLRYDLTAPLARYVAEHFQDLPKPFRRYQVGQVWRNEKPGPGRYREFTQFDADTVGSNSPSADAELLMMVCDALEAVGLKRGEYAVKINSRKFLNGILQLAGVEAGRGGAVLRALDKFDRLREAGVRALLGEGRKDESGDFTKGAGLTSDQIAQIMRLFTDDADDLTTIEGFNDLKVIRGILADAGYGSDRISIDLSIIRGLDYYTGPVFEVQLTFPVKNDDGEVLEVHCTYDPATRGGNAPDGRKVKSTIHWVSAAHAIDAEVRIYDKLFTKENPNEVSESERPGERDFTDNLNPLSLEVITDAKLEPSLANAPVESRYQFERLGYFCVDPDSKPGKIVFNRTVALKDTWAKLEKKQGKL